jgi:hypothetical protein
LAGSLASLAKRARSINEALPDRVNAQTVQVATKLVEELISSPPDGTPVDTSQAMSNWQVGVERPKRSYVGPHVAGKAGSSAGASRTQTRAEAVMALANRKVGQRIYISNNAPYIRRLAYEGHSKQSPPGWVEGAVLITKKFLGTIRKTLLRNL